jgi:hypothetical protein
MLDFGKWTWSYGPPPERSMARSLKEDNKPDFSTMHEENQVEPARNPSVDVMEDAMTANMAIDCQFAGLEQQQIMRKTNSREVVNNKLEQRIMMPTGGQNPFLASNSYINDLQVQSEFLRPQSQYRGDNM